ncbi:hypothetical protein Nham_3003 [Nitrobacter hamburgensis X14]|uniref:Uncharacterized protein n=1 Tax=Nitrobacter hamburgensis (strain DSM 10229 / NCIMB 13809 / X14) TaxID=323097 RepID=Q1QJ41_NITHX|nr:hypothetical protein [Nitrobacter hamburgensis]ABE63756.1 hypothetical protein Nham_3003 [Nitrobacter hamburgensis X14]
MLAALIPALVNRGVLSPQDANEIYENALMMIEMQQGADPAVQCVYEAAREWKTPGGWRGSREAMKIKSETYRENAPARHERLRTSLLENGI